MKLSPNQADMLEEALASPAWTAVLAIIEERVEGRERQLRLGKLDHEEYIRVCESIRECEYLRDRPLQLIREARFGLGVHS